MKWYSKIFKIFTALNTFIHSDAKSEREKSRESYSLESKKKNPLSPERACSSTYIHTTHRVAKCTKMQFSIPFKCTILSPPPYSPIWKTDYKPLGIDQPAYISDPNALMIAVVECSYSLSCKIPILVSIRKI